MKNILNLFTKWLGIFIFVTHAFALSALPCHGNCREKIINLSEKMYLNPDQIDIVDAQIYVNINDTIYETTALYSDEQGYYIQTVKGCAWFEWKCSKCGYCNLRGIEWACKSCGKLKDDP